MSYCLNSACSVPQNLDHHRFCQSCGSKLWLKERYQAIKLIGQGGFGKTFLAIDHDKPRKPYCVIKQFFPQLNDSLDIQKAAELFAQEAIRLDELGKHPQIPALLAYFIQEDQEKYLVQEYIAGQNLEQELKNRGIFNQAEIQQLLVDLLPIIEFIHQSQVIHRDIKPENIIRREQDNKLVLVDFGAAKAVTSLNRSVTGTVIGSAEYMAPEQLNGKAINASDLYSLGVTCLYLLTGVFPSELFDSGEHEWIWQKYLDNNPVSNDLEKIINRMINFGTKKRYQSAKEILQDLGIDFSVLMEQKFTSTSEPIIYIVSSPDLKSAKNVDYTELRNLLKDGNWKGADQETGKVMCQLVDRIGEKYFLTEEEIDKFPCEDMRTINQLWNYYSNGKFGFAVQAEIYRSFNGKRKIDKEIWKKFCERIGWRAGEGDHAHWFGYNDVEFSIDAPIGHLPTPCFVFSPGWKSHYSWNNNISGQGLCGVLFSRASFVFFFSLSGSLEKGKNEETK